MLSFLKDSAASTISLVVVLMFGVVVILLVTRPISISPDTKEILLILLGSLGAAFTQVVSFYLGSSASSRKKDETISDIAKMPVT